MKDFGKKHRDMVRGKSALWPARAFSAREDCSLAQQCADLAFAALRAFNLHVPREHVSGGHVTCNGHVVADHPNTARLLSALVQQVAQRLHLAGSIFLTFGLLDFGIRVLRALCQAILDNIPGTSICQHDRTNRARKGRQASPDFNAAYDENSSPLAPRFCSGAVWRMHMCR